MDIDDERPKASPPLDALEREELDRHSLADLKDRIARLEAEIERARRMFESKSVSQTAAEALFNKPQD